MSGLPERLARQALEAWLGWAPPQLTESIIAAIRAALDDAATVAMTCELTWEASGDNVRGEIAAAIEALKGTP